MNPQQQHEYDNAVQKGHTLFLDHYPIHDQRVIDIYNAVKKKRPELVVAGVARSIRRVGGVGAEYYEAYRCIDIAYADNPNQVVGGIGFESDQYFVTSRLIQNAKYSQWSGRDHRTKKSKHMNNIVKDALKALLPTQFSEVLGECSSPIERNIQTIRDKVRDGLNDKLRHIRYAVLREELEHMAASGYTPKQSVVREAMEYVVASKEEYARNANYNPDKLFIWIKPTCVVYGDCEQSAKQVASTEELPEDVRGKLFVLMVGDKNKFIDEVGMKVEDNKFWVLV